MGNSLLINGLETVGWVTNPEYHLAQADQPGQDFGEILPDTDVISSLLLDGDVITGERTGNRTWNLTVVVQSTSSPPTRADLQSKIDTFLDAINQDSYPVVWTPNGCPSSYFTAYRATFSVAKSFAVNDQLVAQIVFSFETYPFAQSLSPQTVSVAASGGPGQLQVDGMNTGSFTGATLNTTTKYEGAGSAQITLSNGGFGGVYSSPATVGRSISSVNLSSYASASVRLQVSAQPSPGPAACSLTLTLTSPGGTARILANNIYINHGDTSFSLATFSYASAVTSGSFSFAAVTAWSVFVRANCTVTGTPPGSFNCFIDDLRVYPPGSTGNSTSEGAAYNIPAVLGSARTPIALAVTRPSSATFTNLLLHSPPATQDPDLAIWLGLGSGTVTVPAANMNYDGTYSIVGFLTASGSGTRTVTAAFTQKIGGTTVATGSISTTITGTKDIVSIGEIALPLSSQPQENNNGSLVILITTSGGTGTDTWSDVALCDTEGQTVLLTGLASGNEGVWVDQPIPLVGIGPVYQSASDRTGAFSAMALALISGGPMLFEPGNNKLVVAATAGAPSVAVTYTPQWLDEALI